MNDNNVVVLDGRVSKLQSDLVEAIAQRDAAFLTAAGIRPPDEHFSTWPDFPIVRREFIGGSDIAAVLNDPEVSRTSIDVFLDKTGRTAPFEGNKLTEAGTRLESSIVQWWADDHPEVVVIPCSGTWRHPTIPYLAASPDAILIYADGTIGVLEAKNVGQWIQHRWVDGEEAPSHFLWQGIHNAHIIGATKVVITGLIGGNDPRSYEFDMHDSFGPLIESKAAEFWEKVQDGEPPHVEITHAGARESIGAAYQFIDQDPYLELGNDARGYGKTYAALTALAKAHDNNKREAAAAITQALGKAGKSIATVDGIPVVSWNATRSFVHEEFEAPDTRWYVTEAKELARRHKVLYERAKRPTGRQLRNIKPPKKDTQ